MENEERIVRYTMAELKELRARGETLTDWARFDAITDEELEASIDWEDEGRFEWGDYYPGPSAARRQAATVCLDEPNVAWFKARGGDYWARIRFVLRAHVDAKQAKLTAEPPNRRASDARRPNLVANAW